MRTPHDLKEIVLKIQKESSSPDGPGNISSYVPAFNTSGGD